MYIVGDAPEHVSALSRISQECLYKGIEMVRPGVRLGDIGHAIQTHAESTTTLWFGIIVAMVLAMNFIRNRKFYTMENQVLG